MTATGRRIRANLPEPLQRRTLDRRTAIKLVAAASAGLWTPAQAASARAQASVARAQAAGGGPAFAPDFFSSHEFETVHVLVDLIIPADERSGSATDEGVPEFMDFMMIDRPTMQEWMRGGLAWLDIEAHRRFDTAFIDAGDEQRAEILDDIAWADRADDAVRHGAAFFSKFRDLTASGFWSTRAGIEDLGYRGNTVVREWAGCPDEALRHVGVLEGSEEDGE